MNSDQNAAGSAANGNPISPDSRSASDAQAASDSQSAVGRSSDFSLLRVLAVLLVLLPIGGGAAWFLLTEREPPRLVPFSGQVFYQGKPLTRGGILTQPEDSSLIGAVAAIDGEGRFSLMTNGEPGAYLGTHKLAVSYMSEGSPPRPLVPAKYTELRSTPLEIVVSEDASANTVELTLEDPVTQSQ